MGLCRHSGEPQGFQCIYDRFGGFQRGSKRLKSADRLLGEFYEVSEPFQGFLGNSSGFLRGL